MDTGATQMKRNSTTFRKRLANLGYNAGHLTDAELAALEWQAANAYDAQDEGDAAVSAWHDVVSAACSRT
jgi:hypothetical protein